MKKASKKDSKSIVAAVNNQGGKDVMETIKITKDDIVCMAMAAKEEELIQKKEAMEKRLGENRKEYHDLSTKINEETQTFVESVCAAEMKIVNETLERVGLKRDSSYNRRYGKNEFVSINHSYVHNTQCNKIQIIMSLIGGIHYTEPKIVDTPDNIKSMFNKSDELTKEYNQLTATLNNVIADLKALPRLERKTKAELIKNIMSQSRDGKMVIDCLKDIQFNFKSLAPATDVEVK